MKAALDECAGVLKRFLKTDHTSKFDLPVQDRREKERQHKAELARVDHLLGEVTDFDRANEIRNYVESVKRVIIESSNPVAAQKLDSWIAWATAQANRINPILSKRFLEGIAESDG